MVNQFFFSRPHKLVSHAGFHDLFWHPCFSYLRFPSLLCLCHFIDHVGVIEEEIGRGSLYCHLHDTHAPLEWELQLNFLVDIAQGLQYLHHVNSIHPDLTTRKILVTAQWRAKIGCYEFTHLQEKLKNNGVNMHKKDQLNAFTAPELFDKDTPSKQISNTMQEHNRSLSSSEIHSAHAHAHALDLDLFVSISIFLSFHLVLLGLNNIFSHCCL